MKHIHIRKLNPHNMQEVKQCENALNSASGLDADAVLYPATSILVAEDGQPRAYMPIQTCFVMESLGKVPDTTDLSLAAAMKQIVSILVWESRNAGYGEIYFLGSDEGTNQFALNNGFEKVDYPVFRMKVTQ